MDDGKYLFPKLHHVADVSKNQLFPHNLIFLTYHKDSFIA